MTGVARAFKRADLIALLYRYIPVHVGVVVDESHVDVFRTALIHKSADEATSYERLEFLGDAVNSTILTAYIFRRFGREDEAFLSRLRSYMISGKVYAEVSRQIGLPGWVRFGPNNEHLRLRSAVHEDVYEAFVGAMFLAFGFPLTEVWVIQSFEEHMDVSDMARRVANPRERLTNYCLSVFHEKPEIITTKECVDMHLVRVQHPRTKELLAEARAPTAGAAVRQACDCATDALMSAAIGNPA